LARKRFSVRNCADFYLEDVAAQSQTGPFAREFLRPFLRPFSRPRLRRFICKLQIRAMTDGKTDPSAFSRQKRMQ
jgi:hypothetical protein